MRIFLPVTLLGAFCLSATAQTASQMPWYSNESVVSYASLRPGPLSPYSLVTIFGRHLAWETRFREHSETNDLLPLVLPGSSVTVMVNGLAVPVELVSPEQVVFLMPPILGAGEAEIRLVHAGRAGPGVKVAMKEFAPAIYLLQEGVALARHAESYEWVTPEAPAAPGEEVIVYATGLGPTRPPVEYRRIPREPAEVAAREDLLVWLNEHPVPDEDISYAGIMPGFPGIYEIRFRLPASLPSNPQVLLQIGEHTSLEQIRLAVVGDDSPVPEEDEGGPDPEPEPEP